MSADNLQPVPSRLTFSQLTTLAVGGPVGRLLGPQDPAELVDATRRAWAGGEDWMLLGGGSNMVVADEGFDGAVIHVVTGGVERVDPVGHAPSGVPAGCRVRLRVQAGESWDRVVDYAVEHGWAGIEALSGIPGSAGAAPIQNIGAYGQELASSLVAVEFLDHETGDLQHLPVAELGFGYRTSIFKRGRLGLVVAIELELTESQEALSTPVSYAQLAAALGVSVGDRVPLPQFRNAVLRLRGSKGMLLSSDDPDSVSAGSFFTNPMVSENFARALPPEAPRWILDPDAPRSAVKLSAAWLIEHAGIHRGFSLPGSRAAISRKHTLAIVNTGGASTAEVAELARYVRWRVANDFGVNLQPEPVLVGVHL